MAQKFGDRLVASLKKQFGEEFYVDGVTTKATLGGFEDLLKMGAKP